MAKIPEHYQLKNEHSNSYEIHDSRDNSSFHIPKSGLNLDMHAKLSGIKRFAEGGESTSDEIANSLDSSLRNAPGAVGDFLASGLNPPDNPNSLDSQVSQALPAKNPALDQGAPTGSDTGGISGIVAPTNTPQSEANQTPDNSSPSQNVSPGAQPQRGAPDIASQYNNNIGQQVAGIQKESDAKSAQLNESADIQKSANDSMRELLAQSQQQLWNQNVENENLAQAVASTKIDPGNYMASKSTGNKIATALSIVIGGIGAGLTRGPNLALETLNHAIAQDIEAQKANLDNKKSLLSMNLKKYGDMQAATQATMLQMNAMAQGQLAQVASKYGAQANQGNTQAILGQLKNQALVTGQQLQASVMEQKIKQHLASSDVSGQNPLDYIQHVVPADKQKEVAIEVGKAQSASQNHDAMMKLWDQAQKEQTLMKTGAGYARTSPAILQLRALGDPLIHDNDGRVNEFEKKDFEDLLPHAGQFNSTQAELRNGFERFVNNKKSAPLAKSFGIDIDKFNSTANNPAGRLTGADKDAYDYAKANINNAKNPQAQQYSKMILKKLGQ